MLEHSLVIGQFGMLSDMFIALHGMLMVNLSLRFCLNFFTLWVIYKCTEFKTKLLLGYDKLKPFGFPVHAGVNGYSRKILRLEVVQSNNLPNIPAQLYLSSVKQLKGCPVIVRTDCGTENGMLGAMAVGITGAAGA